ncbi:unnamed protein product [Paramecium primaurelia]|uniref:Major facilitator superfamily protein n=1 Tax=Paramecium primaurelia TaxID=5886 RepID=A0A8S1JYK0_PARPR|nr:unnamed protein product [Paramecium primaurelia]
MFEIPKLKKFIFPIIGTLTIFQYSLQQSMPIHTLDQYVKSSKNPKQATETLILQNGIYIFGCVLGTELYKLLANQSSKFIFLLSDVIYFLGNCTLILLYFQSTNSEDNTQEESEKIQLQPIEIYLILRVFVGIANGLNYAQSIIYVKQMSSKKESQFFFKLIPLQLLIGQCLGAYWLESDQQNTPDIITFLNIILILNFVSVLRMILLQFLQIETPQYYLKILKDQRRSKMIYQEIHNDNIQTYFGFEQETLRNNLNQSASEYLISKPYLKKYFKCCLLIVLTQFTGETLIFSFLYTPLHKYCDSQKENNGCQIYWIYAFITGFLMILLQMIFYNFIKRKKIITLIGQAIICIALAFLGFSVGLKDKSWQLVLLQFGYSLGIGTQIFSIIPYQLPEFGILYCINIQWIIGLVEMCFYGLFLNKLPSSDSLEQIHAIQELIQIYFFVSCVGLILIFIILRQPIRTQPQQKIKKEEKKSI